jgi:UDP-N-acetylglucosamine acyltransferase
MDIHPTALVDPNARLASDVRIRAYTIIGANVSIGAGTEVGPHVVLDGWTSIGEYNQIFPFTTVGYPPQDLKYDGGETRVEIGDHNVIRENVTIHRGTELGGGLTRVGSHNLIMAYTHIAHDCSIGNRVVMANAATLGGHVHVEDGAVVGGLVAVHQFVRIGTRAYIGGKSGVSQDVPPFMLAKGYPCKLYGPNLVGLRRQGWDSNAISAIKKAYRIVFRSNLTREQALVAVREELPEMPPEVEIFLKFLENSERGITH